MKLNMLALAELILLVASQLALARPTSIDSLQVIPDPVCAEIASTISSNSDVYYFGPEYESDISHYASSSTQLAKCSVEPGTAEDIGVILQIVGRTRTPFAVKGGGHSANPTWSSTTGVHIAMSRFSEVIYSASSQTAVVGAGLIWDDVYAALEPYNVSVLGGRVTGVGVAGLSLGGGYSWKGNQYGLTVDTVTAFELVKPDGTVANITQVSDSDLFFALRGIVTRFTFKTFLQTEVWGGLITYTLAQIDDISSAVADFQSTITDPKASIITAYNFLLGQPGISQILFYDAPTVPSGIFDKFLAVPHLTSDVDTRTYLSFVKSSPANATLGDRGIFHTISVLSLNDELLSAIANETAFWGTRLSLNSGSFISYSVEPFLPTIFSHASTPSAYPPNRSIGYFPIFLYYAWTLSAFDDVFYDAIRQSAAHLASIAVAQNVEAPTASIYGNYGIFDTPLTEIYGENLPELKRIKGDVDPDLVMNLAGGWKF